MRTFRCLDKKQSDWKEAAADELSELRSFIHGDSFHSLSRLDRHCPSGESDVQAYILFR